MHLQVVVAAETGGALGGMVRQLSIDQFENEGRRVSYGTPESATAARKLLDRQMSINSVPKKVPDLSFMWIAEVVIFGKIGDELKGSESIDFTQVLGLKWCNVCLDGRICFPSRN